MKKGYKIPPVEVSGASALLPLWISWAAKLFSSNEVPFTTWASSSNGFTDASEHTVIYCRASHRAVLPSWSFSSRSSLTRWTDYRQDYLEFNEVQGHTIFTGWLQTALSLHEYFLNTNIKQQFLKVTWVIMVTYTCTSFTLAKNTINAW